MSRSIKCRKSGKLNPTCGTSVRGHDDPSSLHGFRYQGGPSMPWQEVSIMDQRREFVRLAMQEGTNRRELCRRFGIHPDTGYKWLGRWEFDEELADRSRRPHSSPLRADQAIEERVIAVRDAHPAWGARKIARCLEREGIKSPAVSTVHESCAGMAALLGRPVVLRPTSASRSLRRTCCGRWISRAGFPLPTEVAATR